MRDAFRSWLWPDRAIGKRESRQIREEHNIVVTSHGELYEAARLLVSFANKNNTINLTGDLASAVLLARKAVANVDGK